MNDQAQSRNADDVATAIKIATLENEIGWIKRAFFGGLAFVVVCLGLFFGITLKKLSSKVDDALKTVAVEEARNNAESFATAAEDALKRTKVAEKEAERLAKALAEDMTHVGTLTIKARDSSNHIELDPATLRLRFVQGESKELANFDAAAADAVTRARNLLDRLDMHDSNTIATADGQSLLVKGTVTAKKFVP